MSVESVKPIAAALSLRRLYCNKAIFEHRLVPVVEDPPRPSDEVQVEIGIDHKVDPEDASRFSVQLVVRVNPDADLDQPYFVEVAYVGDFSLDEGLQGADLRALASVNCAAILLPYVRQTVSDLTSRGTNGPIVLQPMNVAAMLAGSEEE